MDPYLEDSAFWPDFHRTFINYWREAIADQLPPNYDAGISEQVYLVEQPPETKKLISPNVSVSQDPLRTTAMPQGASAIATLEPVTIPVAILDEPTEPYLEIIHRPDQILVAVLEVLSPANKEEPGWRAYLTKRNALLRQKVHLVELDLLLRGHRLPMDAPLPAGDYYYLICRAQQKPDCQVYSWTFRQPMPSLPVPLQAPDPDIVINLGAVFSMAYERGRFFRRLRYDQPPPVRRNESDERWIQEQAHRKQS
jgi:hypothetical protein